MILRNLQWCRAEMFRSDENNPRSYPAKADFATLLAWHLDRGTRPDYTITEPGMPWTRREFAAALGEHVDQPERKIGYWLKGQSLPRYYEIVERTLFGENAYDEWRHDFRLAYQRRKPEHHSYCSLRPEEFSRTRIFRKPFEFETYGLISRSACELRQVPGTSKKKILAQVDFYEKLSVKGEEIEVYFGVSRAIISFKAKPPAKLRPENQIQIPRGDNYVRFVQNFRDCDFAFAIDPPIEAVTLGELSLPPSKGENNLCMLATTENTTKNDLETQIHVRLTTEGLELLQDTQPLDGKRQQQLLAIVLAAIAKDKKKHDGFIIHNVDIDEE